MVNVVQKKQKVIKRNEAKVAAKQTSLARNPASGGTVATVPPTKLSFADIVSGQLVRNLFQLQ
jgi:hypothetical protein